MIIIKISSILMLIVLFSFSDVISQNNNEQIDKLIIGKVYKVRIINGWEAEGELKNIDSSNIIIQTKNKSFTIPKVEITLIEGKDGFIMENGITKKADGNKFKFGILGGLDLAKAIFNSEATNTRSGIEIGILFEFYTSKLFSIQPGISYIQKGSKFENEVVVITQKMNYLEFPLICNFKFTSGKIAPYLSTGFYLSTRVSCYQNQEYSSGERYEYDTKEYFDKADLGWIAGGGVNFTVSKSTDLFVNFYYSMGLTNIINSSQSFDNATVHNRGMQITAGVKLF
ncbi:MAG: PorT family protein [Ignavibacteria bacterium]|nr:PorT family protein [Ignavibacteria bacterium]